MQSFQFFINQLTKSRNIHISVLDLSGILTTSCTKIKHDNVIHSKKFCALAKSTERGYQTCLLCKLMANTKAKTTRKSFVGQCVYGLYEGASPVIIDGACVAIVYVGNAIVDIQSTKERISKTCKHTFVKEQLLYSQLEHCEKVAEANELMQIAQLVADYLKLVYKNAPKENKTLNWIVEAMKNHAQQRYSEQISLREFALTYQRNPKYLGRLFQKQMGVKFNEYLNEIRLSQAKTLIKTTDRKIIDIAMDCGFFNLSYFNRLFNKKQGVSPTKYRKEHR